MTKQEIRSFYKLRRLTLSSSDLFSRSKKIGDLLFSNFQMEGKTISIFLPIEKQNELNTYYILEKGISIGVKFGLPKINAENHTLIHYAYETPGQLAVNELGIPEPTYGKIIKPKQFDFVLVPLMATDINGHRVGYGKGYYDRFLSECSPTCQFIGLTLFDEFVIIDNVEEHDMVLNYCITPNQIHRFEK